MSFNYNLPNPFLPKMSKTIKSREVEKQPLFIDDPKIANSTPTIIKEKPVSLFEIAKIARNKIYEAIATKEEDIIDLEKFKKTGFGITKQGGIANLNKKTGKITTVDPTGVVGAMKKVSANIAKPVVKSAFTGLKNLSTKLINEAKKYKIHNDGYVEFLEKRMQDFSEKVDNLKYVQEANKKNLSEVISLFNSSKGRQYNNAMIDSLSKSYPENFNSDGTITLYRGGDIRDGVNSFTINKGDAKGYAMFGYGSGKGTSGKLNEVKIKPENVEAVINGEEFLIDLKNIKSQGGYIPVRSKSAKTPPIVPKAFTGLKGLSTKLIEDLKGKITVPKSYIEQRLVSSDLNLKQVEKDLIRNQLLKQPDNIDVSKFAEKVQDELLPLKIIKGKNDIMNGISQKYEFITLPQELRGNVQNYSEHIYESPIKTSAGDVHFSGETENYFGHTRVEDLADSSLDKALRKPGGTRRVIEVQSDLYQRGRIESELKNNQAYLENVESRKGLRPDGTPIGEESIKNAKDFITGAEKLKQYNDPTAHYRIVREEVKLAAQDGKTKLQFPTGETAMKIEGLYQEARQVWAVDKGNPRNPTLVHWLKPNEELKVGQEILRSPSTDFATGERLADDKWIITDVLGDGKFKAIPKNKLEEAVEDAGYAADSIEESDLYRYADKSMYNEEFDISGKVDTNNPIYKFYEKNLGKYLQSKYKAKLITDDRGVKWHEVDIKPEMAKKPVEAFGFSTPQAILGTGVAGAGLTALGLKANNIFNKPETKDLWIQSGIGDKQNQYNFLPNNFLFKPNKEKNNNPIINITDDQKNKVIATIIGEGISEGEVGMQAILNNIISRAEKGYRGSNLFEVVSSGNGAQYNAFSVNNQNYKQTLDYLRGQRDASPAIKKATEFIKSLLEKYDKGELEDLIGGNINYLNPTTTTERGKELSGFNKRDKNKDIVIGNHVFWSK